MVTGSGTAVESRKREADGDRRGTAYEPQCVGLLALPGICGCLSPGQSLVVPFGLDAARAHQSTGWDARRCDHLWLYPVSRSRRIRSIVDAGRPRPADHWCTISAE